MTFSQLFVDPKPSKDLKPMCNCSNDETLSSSSNKHDHMGAFIYTCVIVLLFASSIVYFMLRRICFQDRMSRHSQDSPLRRSSFFRGRGPNKIFVKSRDSGDVVIDFESLVRANERALRSKFKRDLCHHLNEIGHIAYNPDKIPIPMPTPPTPVPTELENPLEEEMSRTFTASTISEGSETPVVVRHGQTAQPIIKEAPKFVFDEDSISCYH